MKRAWALVSLLAFAALLLSNLDAIVVQYSMREQPHLDSHPLLERPIESRADGSKALGPCWFREHRGQNVIYVEGDPFALGYCNTRLTTAKHILQEEERSLHQALDTFVPFKPLQHALLRALLFTYRDLPSYVSDSNKLEIYGFARGYSDPRPDLGPAFDRILFYHAVHDIGQALVDNPILGCSAFVASGPATADGHTLLARDFDFEGGKVFDQSKVVLFVRPDIGIPFVSVIWAGMAGAVSGMNSQRIGVVLNAAGSDDFDTTGTPTTLVVRSVLQHAATLDQAISIIRASKVFVSDILTIADGKTGEQAIVELTPRQIRVRYNRELSYATNHFLDPAFRSDGENGKRMREGTTIARFQRLAELLEESRGHLDPATAQRILRDRRAPGGRELGLGNRAAIDALIAAHAVIFDLTSGTVWVSSAPHTLGAFVRYELDEVLGGRFVDHDALPADPLLANGSWERFERAQMLLDSARALEKERRIGEAIESVEKALELAPRHPPAMLRLAELLEKSGDRAGAGQAYQAFLDANPPNHRTAEKAAERLAALSTQR